MKSRIWSGMLIAALAAGGCGGTIEQESAAKTASPSTAPEFDPAALSAGEGEAFYAGPTGRDDAEGTLEDPWSLARALAHPAEVQPGDTIWILEGVYSGTFLSLLAGTPEKPIVVRAAPGHRVVIDSGAESAAPALSIHGADSWVWGVEILSSNPNRKALEQANPERIDRATGVYMLGQRSKLVNSVVHDVARGLVMAPEAIDAEAYGNVIYYCGWSGGKRGYGSAISVRNAQGSKFLEENVQFSGFENGIQCMGDDVRGVRLRGNVTFNSGVLFENRRTTNLLVSATNDGVQDLVVDGNHSYYPVNEPGGSSALGWVYGGAEESAEATGNYWVGGMTPVEVWNWSSIAFSGNTVVAAPGRVLVALTTKGGASGYAWDGNRYYGSKFFRAEGAKVDFDSWKAQTGLDRGSEWHGEAPTGVWSVVRPNRYEPGRGHVIIYNWDGAGSVELDMSGVFSPGSEYQLRDVQNLLGEPMASGCYEGGPVAVNLPEKPRAALPVGLTTPPDHSGPMFWTLLAASKAGCGAALSSNQ